MLRRIFFKDDRLRPVLRLVVYGAGIVVAYALVATPLLILYSIAHPGADLRRVPEWLSVTCECAAVVGTALALRRYLDRRSIASLGLSLRAPWLRLFGIGLLCGAGMQLVAFVLNLGLGFTNVTGVSALGFAAPLFATWGSIFLLSSLAEETAVRGYALQNLWEEFGFVPALILTALFFALVHLGNPNVGGHRFIAAIDIAGDGVWAALAVLWTRSLWLAFGAHFAWNLFEGPVLGTPVSGFRFDDALIGQAVSGPTWFTGGSFGPEAGVSGLIALAVGGVALYALYRKGAFASVPDTREPYAVDVVPRS